MLFNFVCSASIPEQELHAPFCLPMLNNCLRMLPQRQLSVEKILRAADNKKAWFVLRRHPSLFLRFCWGIAQQAGLANFLSCFAVYGDVPGCMQLSHALLQDVGGTLGVLL